MSSLLKVMIGFMGYTIMVPYFFGNESIGNRFLGLALVTFFYIVYNFNVLTDKKHTNYNLIKWSVPLILFTAFNTLRQLLINPTSSREIKNSGEDTINLWKLGVGGYDFIYFLTLLAVVILGLLYLKKLNFKFKLVLRCMLTFILAVVILSNYFTAIIMLLSSFVILQIFKNFSIIKVFVLLVGSILLLIYGKLIMISFLDIIINFVPEGKNLMRLMALKDELGVEQGTSVLNQRDSYVIDSYNGFLNNPFFGMVVDPINLNKGIVKNFGQHSQFLDTLSLFGLIGFIQIYFILKPFMIRLNDNVNLRSFSLSMLASTLIIHTFNNSAPLIGFAFFFIYPTVYDFIRDKNSNKSELKCRN